MNSTALRFGITVLALGVSALSHAQDYLSPDLRTQVDQLRKSRDSEISNQANARDRARLVWLWLNGFAMTGRHVPVNATQYMNSILALDKEERVSAGLLKELDDLIKELSVRDENPDALGAVGISNSGPFVIDSWQTIEVTYTIGDLSLVEGGVVLVSRHFRDDGVSWQNTEPARDGFISIRASDPSVAFEPTTVPVRGMHGGFRAPQPQIAFRVTSGTLDRGEQFTVVYGDTTGGGRGFQVQSYSNDAAPLPLYVDFNRDSVFFSLPIATYAVVGKETFAVHGFAPAIVGTGEKFDVSVRCEDEYYNRATGPIPALDVSLNGQPYASLPAGSDAIRLLRDVIIATPGVYRFSFANADGRVQGSSDPVWVQANPSMRIYWGETHGHCGFAEGQGSAESYFEFGRDDARLDFLTLSEHDIWMDDYEWKQLNELSAHYSDEGRFVVFPGYEWTAQRDRGGHHNVFFRRPGFDRVPGQDAPTLADLYIRLHAKYAPSDVLVIPHAHQAADWRSSDVYLERLVEIMSAHGTFEWFGDRYLAFGHEVGFISASDDHLSHPGYSTGTRNGIGQRGGLAAVYARELTTDGVFDALRNRQTYATSGARIILDASLNGYPMGIRQPYADTRQVKGRVMGSAPIAEVSLIKNGNVIHEVDHEQAALDSRSWIQVGFRSDSAVPGRENPRGYRPWRGRLSVSGATIRSLSAPGFQDRRVEWARIDESQPNIVDFSTATRGRLNMFVLEMENVTDETKIDVELIRGREYGTAPTLVRPPADLQAATATFAFADLRDGEEARTFEADRYQDELTLKVVDPNPALDREFEFSDESDPERGDYYYIRIRQTDGGLAWSSPFWVGGESPR